MKTEIVNFINDLPVDVHTYNLSLDKGLYVFVDLDDNGGLLNSEKEFIEEDAKREAFYKKCLLRVTNSKMLTSNKRYNQSFEIGSPFGIGFKKDVLYGNDKKEGYSDERIKEKIDSYFDVAIDFIIKNRVDHVKWLNAFKMFCQEQLISFSNQLFNEFTKSKAIYIFLKDVPDADFENSHKKYLSERGVFNDPKSAITFNGKKYQVSDTLNGFGVKKIFLEHKTAPFNLNMLIDDSDAINIWKFFELVSNKVLPNPCPIFIDKKELPDGEKVGTKVNKEIIRIVNSNAERKLSYSQVIKKLYTSSTYKKYLANYYLIFFQFISQKGYRVIDVDFVPIFQYEIADMKIFEIFSIGGRQEKQIENIFEFEDEIVSKIFDSVLVSVFEGGKTIRYFFDFSSKESKNQLKGLLDYLKRHNKDFNGILNQVLIYRKALYDYIYKSKREAIKGYMFHDIMLKGVLDDLKADEYKNNKHSKWYSIREKLNIWFSLFEYFNYNNKKEKSMASRITEHLELMQDLIGGKRTLQNDNEFAFATGQVLYYLLSKSESADRSYARLEPFLQKTDCLELQKAISNAFNTYKHKTFSKNFKKPFAEVMDYQTRENIKSMMPTILAGFFAENSLFANKEDDEENPVNELNS